MKSFNTHHCGDVTPFIFRAKSIRQKNALLKYALICLFPCGKHKRLSHHYWIHPSSTELLWWTPSHWSEAGRRSWTQVLDAGLCMRTRRTVRHGCSFTARCPRKEVRCFSCSGFLWDRAVMLEHFTGQVFRLWAPTVRYVRVELLRSRWFQKNESGSVHPRLLLLHGSVWVDLSLYLFAALWL